MMNAAANHAENTQSLVVGLGLTGWSVVRFLAERGHAFVVTDSRDEPPYLDSLRARYPDVPFLPKLPASTFDNYDELIVSPGVAVSGDHVVGDIELFAREAKAPVIAITGSNGKSTVTSLVGEMLNATRERARLGGNIGTPALDLLGMAVPEVYVLELSSFQLDTTHSLLAAAATVLNISEDHMDRYKDLGAYREAKLAIYRGCRHRVVNRDDPHLSHLAKEPGVVSFGLDEPGALQFGVRETDQGAVMCVGSRELAPVDAMTLQGRQNVSNMLAAFALVQGAGFEIDQPMIEAALAYPGLPHRCELVGEWDSVRWINDSKGTNVGATLAAIRGTMTPLVLIAGGQGKGADFSDLGAALGADSGAAITRSVVLIGEDAERIASVLPDNVIAERADSLDEAILLAKDRAEPGDTVLFSPACASFDMFASFEDRGDQFRDRVRTLIGSGGLC